MDDYHDDNDALASSYYVSSPPRSYALPFVLCGMAAVGFAIWAFALLKERNALEARLKLAETNAQALQQEDAAAADEMMRRHAAELAALDKEWQGRLDDLKARQTERLRAAYDEFNRLVAQGDDALSYIGQLETKLREGQELSDAELEKLAAIGSGLTVLQQQYRQPMGEFTQLGEYFAAQASQDVEAPDMRFALLKRIFSRSFRAQEREYYEELGKQQAFENAYSAFTGAYTRAQSQMNGLGETLEQETAAIYAMIDERKTSVDELQKFFDSSRRTLSIHREMLEFEPEIDIPPAAQP